MFEQRRCQRGATREDKVRAVLRLDAANALGDVRSKALERAPFKTFRTVGSDIFCCRIEAVRHRTARRLWPRGRQSKSSAAIALENTSRLAGSNLPQARFWTADGASNPHNSYI